MTLREVTGAFSYMMRSFNSLFAGKSTIAGKSSAALKYSKQFVLALSACALLVVGFLGYRWYQVYKIQQAQKQFAEYLQEFHTTLREPVKDWDRIEMLFKLGAQQHKNTSFGPYFLAFQAQALLQQGKKDEALQLMDTMIESLSPNHSLYTLFKTQRALMHLDMPDDSMKERGIQELTELARDAHNVQRDMALFYLGSYYWTTDNLAEAKKVWQELIEQSGQETLSPSPWAVQAQSKLNQISL